MMFSSPELKYAVEAVMKAGRSLLEASGSDSLRVSSFRHDGLPVTEAEQLASAAIAEHLRPYGAGILGRGFAVPPYSDRKAWNACWLVDPLDRPGAFLNHDRDIAVTVALMDSFAPVIGVVYAPMLDDMYLTSPSYGAWYIDGVREAVESGFSLASVARQLIPQEQGGRYRIINGCGEAGEALDDFLAQLEEKRPGMEVVHCQGALGYTAVAAGEAEMYICGGGAMEWQTSAGHALLNATGKSLTVMDGGGELRYNKEELIHPPFIAS